MKRVKKRLDAKTWVVLLFLLPMPFILYKCFSFFYSAGFFERTNIFELKYNYAQNSKAIHALRDYYLEISNPEIEIYVRLNFNGTLDIRKSGFVEQNGIRNDLRFNELNINDIDQAPSYLTHEGKLAWKSDLALLDTLLVQLEWTFDTLRHIKQMLYDANCSAIINGDPVEISFKRSAYHYKIFSTPLDISDNRRYNDSCTNVYLNEHVTLYYNGGVLDARCFPDFDD